MKFKPAEIPDNEKNRLLAVEKTGVLDTVNEELYDVYSHLARKITDCPLSWANVMDTDRQYNFVMDAIDITDKDKAEHRENPRETSFCQYALNSTKPLIVNDLKRHDIFRNHPSVLKEAGPRFYAAFPLVNSEGYILGSLCVRDQRVRRLSKEIIELMKSLANKLAHQLDIQARQRSVSAEAIISSLEFLKSEFVGLDLNVAIGILRLLSNLSLSQTDTKTVQNLNLLDRDGRLNKKSRKLQKQLGLDAGILKRFKGFSSDNVDLKTLFKALD